jgi:hypothetical protein
MGRPTKKRRSRPAIPNTYIKPGGTMPRDITYFKPKRYKDYLTLAEMSREVGCDPSWLRKLERAGRIPEAQRVQRGTLAIRLWSPAQRDEIVEIIRNHRVGRPPKDE